MCLSSVCFITQSVCLCLPLGYKRVKEHVKLSRHTRGLLCKWFERRQIVTMSRLKITVRFPRGGGAQQASKQNKKKNRSRKNPQGAKEDESRTQIKLSDLTGGLQSELNLNHRIFVLYWLDPDQTKPRKLRLVLVGSRLNLNH